MVFVLLVLEPLVGTKIALVPKHLGWNLVSSDSDQLRSHRRVMYPFWLSIFLSAEGESKTSYLENCGENQERSSMYISTLSILKHFTSLHNFGNFCSHGAFFFVTYGGLCSSLGPVGSQTYGRGWGVWSTWVSMGKLEVSAGIVLQALVCKPPDGVWEQFVGSTALCWISKPWLVWVLMTFQYHPASHHPCWLPCHSQWNENAVSLLGSVLHLWGYGAFLIDCSINYSFHEWIREHISNTSFKAGYVTSRRVTVFICTMGQPQSQSMIFED